MKINKLHYKSAFEEHEDLMNKLLMKKSPERAPLNINITDIRTRSCGNCAHYLGKKADRSETCMHYPTARMIEINTKICKHNERELWSPKKYGLIRRFLMWLF